jgi:hypothetical protein
LFDEMPFKFRRPGGGRGPGILMFALDSGFRRNDDRDGFRRNDDRDGFRRNDDRATYSLRRNDDTAFASR